MNKREEKTAALIVIDVQNYFFKKGQYAYINGSEKILKNINKLVVAFSQKGLKVLFTKQIYPKSPNHPMRRWWRRLPHGYECRLYNGLILPKDKIVIEKEYYSAFFGTKLQELLKDNGIKRLFFCGVMTHLCVETTIREAFMLGFDSFLIEDATMSKNKEHHLAAILNLSHGFCKIIRSEKIYEYI